MPSPKDGTAGSAVPPVPPDSAQNAADAVAGGVDQTGGGGATKAASQQDSVPIKPYKKDNTKKSWIEIKLVDEENNPVPGQSYSVTLPDGETVAGGSLDEKGFARIDGIDPGTCQITFPDLDKDAWEKA